MTAAIMNSFPSKKICVNNNQLHEAVVVIMTTTITMTMTMTMIMMSTTHLCADRWREQQGTPQAGQLNGVGA